MKCKFLYKERLLYMFEFKRDEVVLDTEIDTVRKSYICDYDKTRRIIYYYVEKVKLYQNILSLFNEYSPIYKEVENKLIFYKNNLEKSINEFKEISKEYKEFCSKISDSMLNTTKIYGNEFADYTIVLEEALRGFTND